MELLDSAMRKDIAFFGIRQFQKGSFVLLVEGKIDGFSLGEEEVGDSNAHINKMIINNWIIYNH